MRTWALALLLAASCGPGGGTGGGGGGTGGGTGGTGGVLCIPGASAACTCTNGRQGAQLCNADGKSLGACVCSGDVGGGGTTGTGGIGGSVGANGGTGGASAGAGGAAGTGGTGLGCQGSLPPEIRFGSIGQGDANPSFQSAVGALGADAMYIFSGSTSSASGGASGSQTVYVQAFDLETGASRGPAQPLFSPPNLDLESAREPGGSVSLFAAAVADTGDIALAYQLKTSATSKAVLYVAFLAAPAATDGGAQALQLQDVRLVSLSASAGAAANDATNPKLFWSNASRTFVLNYVSRASQQPLASATALQISVLKYTASGQNAGGIGAVPVPSSFSEYPPKILAINGGVGESGSLLGVLYGGWDGVQSLVYRTTLGEDATPVGTPTSLGLVTPHTNMMEIAGTAKGFVCAFFGSQYVSVSFVPTSAGSGAADGGAGGGGFGGLMSLGPMTNAVGRAIADDVGSGGKGGVGLALGTAQGIVFGYVNADGTAIAGPTTVFPGDVEAMAMTNFNGRFAISAYSATAHSARVVASGVCP